MLAFALLVLTALPVSAQGSLPFAAVTQDQVILYGLSDTPQAITAPGQFSNYFDLAWSPDGNTLALVVSDADFNSPLLVSDRAGSPPITLVSKVISAFPLSFTADGQILYAVDTGEFIQRPDQPGGVLVNVFSSAPTVGATPTLVGRFEWIVGCGGGSSIPAHWRYWEEAKTGPGGSSLILALTPFGLVHSMNCTGVGTALLNPATDADVELGEQLGWARVSPDGTKVVGISRENAYAESGQLVVVDLATQTTTALPTAAPVVPDLVTWGADGSSVFYSAIQKVSDVPGTPEGQQKLAEAIGYLEPTTLPVNEAAIHRLNLSDNADTQIYAGDAFAVGRMIALPGGNALLFSLIPNVDDWVAGIVDGTIEAWAEDTPQRYFQVELYYLDLASGAASLIGQDLSQVAFNTGAYSP
jgi:hypothetical protein